MYLFAISKTGKNEWKLIERPRRILIILDNVSNIMQFIIDTDENLDEFITNPDFDGFCLTISNDPQQDPYGQVTNLGYSSIKIHIFKGQFVDGGFNYITILKEVKPGVLSGMLRYNFPTRRPLRILGEKRPLFEVQGMFEVYELTFDKTDPDILYSTKLFNNFEGGFLTKTKHDMGCIVAGTELMQTKKIKNEQFEKEFKRLVK